MSLNRRTALTAATAALAATALATPAMAAAENPELANVMNAVEAFRTAMLRADEKAFDALCAADLSYGHSAGAIEDKALFIKNSISGNSRWLDLNFNDRKISISGNNAIARFMLTGQTLNKENKTTDIKIGVLMVWQRQAGGWKLLARQAFRV